MSTNRQSTWRVNFGVVMITAAIAILIIEFVECGAYVYVWILRRRTSEGATQLVRSVLRKAGRRNLTSRATNEFP